MKILHKYTYLLIAIFVIQWANAQDISSFSLDEAVTYGLQNNANIKKAQNNVLKAKKKVWETTSMGFQQIDVRCHTKTFWNNR